jgi:hypothetical protein
MAPGLEGLSRAEPGQVEEAGPARRTEPAHVGQAAPPRPAAQTPPDSAVRAWGCARGAGDPAPRLGRGRPSQGTLRPQ